MQNFLFHKKKFAENKRLLLFYANDFIDLLGEDSFRPSCKPDLLEAIKAEIDSCEKEISRYTPQTENIPLIARRMVCTNSFEVLESGKYHLLGHVNWTGAAYNMRKIHESAIKWALENDIISQEDYDEDLLALKDAINQHL